MASQQTQKVSPPKKKWRKAVRSAEGVRKERDRRRKRSQEIRSFDADVGVPILTPAQRRRGTVLRKACQNSLLKFNLLCFPNSTGLKPLGQVQIDSVLQDESVIVHGGRVAKAEPRGYGKTTRGCNAALWAALYGYRRMVPVFSANMDKSKTQIMSRWKTELAGNELLYWMFPELIWPLRCLENKPQRCASQTYLGKPTHSKWTADRIALPFIEGQSGAGSILVALPLKSCRGATHTRPDGTVLRPDLLMFDDVQNDEDADNPATVQKMMELIDHTAMMLGGHSQSMSAIMNFTVRRPDDLGDRCLQKSGWRRVRYKMLANPAIREKELWLGQYAELRRNYDPDSVDDQQRAHKEALEFYLSHREAMEEGADVTWEWAYSWQDADPVEVSAIQHAYNILIDLGDEVFASECQNEPIRDTSNLGILPPDQVRLKQSGYDRGVPPRECVKLTAFIDVHPQILYYQVWGWEPLFTGFLLEDEAFPSQRRRNFSHGMLAIPLDKLFPGMDDNARVTAALDALLHGNERFGVAGLLQREWLRSDQVPMKIALCGVDANGSESDAIKKFIRQSPFSSLVYPSYGRGVGATSPPMSQWQQHKKGNCGPEWVHTTPVPGEPQGVLFDTNYWKTRFHRALSLPIGSQGALQLYKTDPENHRMLSEHWYSEIPKEVICGSRIVYEFPKTSIGDNHKLDVAVGAMVAASKAGISSLKKAPPRRQVSLAELRARARQRNG